jgi:hypothetical protein
MDDATALKRLRLLLKEDGALKIILPFHACASGELVTDAMVTADPSRRDACEDYATEHGHASGMPGGYTSVGHYQLAEVKRIEESPREGVYIAYADDDKGSRTSGKPAALLARLTEHERS